MSIEEILDLEQLEVNIYRGSVFSPESGFLQRTFGGHVAGQSLVSAVRTVDPRYMVHSLHGYFLRPGDAKERTVFLVERIRDGGSFCTRRVNAVQHGKPYSAWRRRSRPNRRALPTKTLCQRRRRPTACRG